MIEGLEKRILILDSEWLPNVGYFWQTGKQYITPEQIKTERSMMMFQHMWLEEDEATVISIGDKPRKFKKNPHDDEYVVRAAHKILMDADIWVIHNEAFDRKMFNARALFYRLPPVPKKPVICTLKEYRKHFRLNSNKLDHILKYLGEEGKDKVGWEDFIAVVNGCKKALAKIAKYGAKDCILLKKAYLAVRPYMTNHPNMALIAGKYYACRVCASGDLSREGYRYTATGRYQQYSCNSCGAWGSDGVANRKVNIR